ncbi:DNA-directed RNA polymerase, subunit E'' [Candidatus Pacearchaeota archaeon]|nr:DNA-directed RNA polymerase, subunit E'' [Candidatus Pacearchaeota archaeon]
MKSCKKCKALTNGSTCPNCQSAQLVDNWKGRVVILNTEQSEIAKRLNVNKKGEYALKI